MKQIILLPQLDEDILVSYHNPNEVSIYLTESDKIVKLGRDDVIELVGFLSEFIDGEE